MKTILSLSFVTLFVTNMHALSHVKGNVKDSITCALSIQEARNYFEKNVTEFRWFTSISKSYSLSKGKHAATPIWENAEVCHIRKKNFIDIPLDAPVTVVSKIRMPKDTIYENRARYKVNTAFRLLAEKNILGEYFFTVAAITCNRLYLEELAKKYGEKFEVKFSNIPNFCGEIRYFNLKGEFLYGYGYENGRKRTSISISVSNEKPTFR